MKTDNIYEEKIFSKWITVILAVAAVGLLFSLIYQILVGPIGGRSAPNWDYLVGFLLLLGIAINFSTLSIKMTSQVITVGYGIFKNTILWEDIDDCYLDEASAIRYGGWGIRMGMVGGKWRSVYNIIGEPRIVLSLKKGRFFKEFVFSTKNLDKAMEIIKQKISGSK